MIITELQAGLGNQMFHYAAGRVVAEELNIPLKLDISSFQQSSIYQYELTPFNIIADFATEKEIDEAVNLPTDFWSRTQLRITEKLKPAHKRRSIIRETDYHFTNQLAQATQNCYITGHWQSEKYFKKYDKLIRQEFSLKNNLTDDRTSLLQEINNTCAVSLVVRRGDYLKYDYLNLYGNDMTFYYNAMEIINSKVSNPHYFVFSDDIEWVKSNLILTMPHTFVSEPYPGDAYKVNPRRHLDLILMSRCKHHIITNSTFAWWGAWLNPNENKVVVAPKQWFKADFSFDGIKPANTQDVIPENWIKI
jgi:hypothetical protein